MHKDTGEVDGFETLCSIPVMKVQRLRMRNVLKVENLKAPGAESVLIPLMGSVTIKIVGDKSPTLGEKDVCYITRGSAFSIEAQAAADVVWAYAPADNDYPSYVKRFEDVKPVVSGAQTYSRHIYTCIGDKDMANRFIVGFVEGDPGNWTSFPPHRHDGKPEVYVYYGMGKRFGVQVVSGKEDRAYLVREGDAVLFEEGYHPNVATPGVGMNFAWIISADPKDRNLAVELHPEYKDMPMGQTHLTTK
jgi:5-deoxy-glucuronate isomerase